MEPSPRCLFVCCLLLLALVAAPPAAAQAGPVVVGNEAVLDFPETVTFRLTLADGAAVTSASLIFDLIQATCLEVPSRVPVDVTGDALAWEWVMSRSGNPPPGAELWWQWELTGIDGRVVTTPRQTLVFQDDRFEWRTISADGIWLHWYEGNRVGPILLEAAVAARDTLETEMGMALTSDVQLYIYDSATAMRQAVLYIQDWAGGAAFSQYGVILMGVPPAIADSWGRPTVRHELAHLVVGQVGRSCVGGRRPTWLDEGLAMVAEGEPSAQTQADLAHGREENSFAPLRSLSGPFPSHDSEASMAYSQSYGVVSYLLSTYGAEKLQVLLQQLAAGVPVDEALTDVFGFNTDGLEQAWRAASGLPPRAIPPTPTPLSAAAVPTLVPLAFPRSLPTPPTAAQSPAGSPAAAPPARPVVCGQGLLPALLLAGLGWRRIRGGRRHLGPR